MSDKWPASKVEMRSIDLLTPYVRNSRTHSAEQIAQIAASIQEFGWTVPCLIDETGGLICGHARVLAARNLGLVDVPVMVAAGWTEAQKRAYVIADNKLAINAGWNDDLLASEFAGLKDVGFDLALTGFSLKELNGIFGSDQGETDPDEIPDLPSEPVSVAGDIWLLGNHRLACGDCTDATLVDKIMGGKIAALCLTDPPYGLGESSTAKNKYDVYQDTAENLVGLIAAFLPIAQRVARVVVLTPGNKNQWLYPSPTWTMAWFVPAGTGRGPWGFCCWQPLLCYGKDPKLAKGKGSFPDAIVHTESAENVAHPCSKPVGFWSWVVDRASEAGDLIFDPFVGSGTGLIATEQTGRVLFGIEISPAYVDVAVRRWQSFTGLAAVLDGSRAKFDDVERQRKGLRNAA